MLFNGKYYNKPGHLGMTTEEVKAALAGAGKIPAIEAGDAGKAIVVNESENGFELGDVGGALYAHKIRSTDANFPKSVIIVNTSDVAFTKDTLSQYLKDKGFDSLTPLTGTVKLRLDGTKVLMSAGIYYTMSGSVIVLKAIQPYIDLSDSSVGEQIPTINQSIIDTVVAL